MKMGKVVKLELGGGADGSGRNTKESYRTRPGELSGIIKLVMLWHAIGHPVRFMFHTQTTLQLIFFLPIYSTENQLFLKITSELPHNFLQPQTQFLRYPSSQMQSILWSRRLTLRSTALLDLYAKNV